MLPYTTVNVSQYYYYLLTNHFPASLCDQLEIRPFVALQISVKVCFLLAVYMMFMLRLRSQKLNCTLILTVIDNLFVVGLGASDFSSADAGWVEPHSSSESAESTAQTSGSSPYWS